MIFYLSSSKMLLQLFLFLYINMLGAIYISALFLVYKLLMYSFLIYFLILSIKIHGLRIMPYSSNRFFFNGNRLYIENKHGLYVYGKFNNIYLSRKLIIISVTSAINRKNIIILITPDSISHAQFRRLYMQITY